MSTYCHLHNHTQFSLLDGATDIQSMMRKAAADGQEAVALTDHGNMFGAFKFVAAAKQHGLKPIVGCEFYLVKDRFRKAFSRKKGESDNRYHQLLLAKDPTGYRNLSKLCSLGFIEGLYSDYPRIDKSLIEKYHEGLIATSCCIGAEIPQLILHGHHDEAEKQLKWWFDLFGEDFYIELQRHSGLENIDGLGVSQEDINQHLLHLAKKYRIKTIATNDSHYLDQQDADNHDTLLCVNTGKFKTDQGRFMFPSKDFYFKTQDEMKSLFTDIPEALDNTLEIASKVEMLDLANEVALPKFQIPTGFASQGEYLKHLTYQGAKRRYGELTADVNDRIVFELDVIQQSGYPGYFLIVQDITSHAREIGVSVGPGRGSAAGSVVAYCLGITNIDPIKYDLLFERFLNPERISMPDIDMDFDDAGRSKILDYVIQKYGHEQVAQIITYGTMAAKMSIRDVGRVLNVPLSEVNRITKQFPSHLGATLNGILAEGGIDADLASEMLDEDLDKAKKIRQWAEGEDEIGHMLRVAKGIEGSVRNTGIHACGIVITPEPVVHYVPVAKSKDSDLLVTQFDNYVAEDAGLLKMDLLGLRTLSIIKDTVKMIHQRHGLEIDPDAVPLDDGKTYELFQKAQTVGIFQYESVGMRKYLRELKPTRFEDLIAMNALFRPGPMAYIPNFIRRKHGQEPIYYDLPEMESILAETYGITVYQEQVMLLSQKLANFTKGQADALRKAMGKKRRAIIDEMYPLFIEGCLANGHPKQVVDKIWKDWESFASYAFNKSHSTCYAFLAFQTAYLKANYPAEFMAALLANNSNDTVKLNTFLRECRHMKLAVIPPDINSSDHNFTVDSQGRIVIGLAALKGVGSASVQDIIAERANGLFEDYIDMTKRLNLRSVNKKCMEALTLAGAFDSFGAHRSQYFAPSGGHETFIEHGLRFGQDYQKKQASKQMSLFGELDDDTIEQPVLPHAQPWNERQQLESEKEIVGIYVSGHPLEAYRLEMENYVTCDLSHIEQINQAGVRLSIAGIVTKPRSGMTRRGEKHSACTLQDMSGTYDLMLYRELHEKFHHLITEGQVIYVEGSMRERYNSKQIYFQIEDIRLLSTVGEKKTKSITIILPSHELTDNLVARLWSMFEQKKGPHELKFMLASKEESQAMVQMKSANVKIKIDQDVLDELEEVGLAYKLN